jgi:peptidoglycan/xylan/chitin deacetylase (PgdA/CDA1 family)
MQPEHPIELKRGVFTISIDFELIWGTLDLFGPDRFRRACEIERKEIIDRLLDLFVEFEVSATWCVLGHLFLERCLTSNGKHPEIVRPVHSWHPNDWFEHDPGGLEGNDSLFLGRSLVGKIIACPIPQEIGGHSFSHVIFGDSGCSRETAKSELAALVKAASEMGIAMRSFAFPRNEVGHLDALKEYGFDCYRGPERNWYESKNWPAPVKRLCHLWDVITAATPAVALPEITDAGLWNIPASMIYFPMHGLRRYIPISTRVTRAVKGLEAASRRKRVFHLWFHPTNLADQTDAMFSGLRRILGHACVLRARGDIEILSMKSLLTKNVAIPDELDNMAVKTPIASQELHISASRED